MEGEIGGYHDETEDHARHAVVDEFVTAYAVNDEGGEDRGKHVDHTYEHLAEQWIAHAGILEHRRTVVEHGVHAHELSEDGDAHADDDSLEDARTEQLLPLRFRLSRKRLCQKSILSHLEFNTLKPELSQARALLCPKKIVILGIEFKLWQRYNLKLTPPTKLFFFLPIWEKEFPRIIQSAS